MIGVRGIEPKATLTILAVAFLPIGCASVSNVVEEAEANQCSIVQAGLREPGWVCTNEPSTRFRRGLIIRMAEDGAQFDARDTYADIIETADRARCAAAGQDGLSCVTDDLTDTVCKAEHSRTAALKIPQIPISATGASIGAGAESEKKVTLITTISNRERLGTSDDRVDEFFTAFQRDWIEKEAEAARTGLPSRNRDSDRYFLIRDVVQAGKISYALGANAQNDAALKAELKSIADASASLSTNETVGFGITWEDQDNPLVVCTLSEEIEVRDSRGGGDPIFVRRRVTADDDIAFSAPSENGTW